MNLILLPGMDGTGLLFEPLLEALPGWLEPKVIAYPGHEPLGYAELLPLIRRVRPRPHSSSWTEKGDKSNGIKIAAGR